ncbi:uncharacterized protein EI97DRAFT_194702 [Westerdykella ornata]|uniref:Uncharacterized protein n=1 Tax=Westerdykella ornata TaxID=318751 RepID=A0A6A6J8M8_WESOR|nr:uncharacterized protein EI97DRAFT_194702 [Westerdykella ornata]KAF2272921.1 hypothetical protein EI97DRAFT_194702 [Westerdykella ornata]
MARTTARKSPSPSLTLTPLITLPGHTPISTTLTPRQLSLLFPTLHIWMLPSNPLIALLPHNSTTHHGLTTILRWTEHQLLHPHAAFEADLATLIAVHQALAFLGNGPEKHIMRSLDAHIRAEMADELALQDIADLWALRYLPFAEPWIRLLLRHLVAFCRRVEAKFKHPSLPARLRKSRALRCETRDEFRVLHWLWGVEGLFERTERLDAGVDRERLWEAMEGLRVGEMMLRPFLPPGVSAVAGAVVEGRMRVIAEETEEERSVELEELLAGVDGADEQAVAGAEQDGEDADDEASRDREGSGRRYFVENGFESLDRMVLEALRM